MKIMMKTALQLTVLCLSLAAINFAHSDVVVVVNSANSLDSISKSDLARLYLGKVKDFPKGSKATVINQIFASSSRGQFDSVFLGRTEQQMKGYWSKVMFSGGVIPPEEVSGDLEVLKKVSSDTSAIGYLDESAVNDAVKVLTVTD